MITYKAIPYPLPIELREKLMELGKNCVEARRVAHQASNRTSLSDTLDDVEQGIRDVHGVVTTRKLFVKE